MDMSNIVDGALVVLVLFVAAWWVALTVWAVRH